VIGCFPSLKQRVCVKKHFEARRENVATTAVMSCQTQVCLSWQPNYLPSTKVSR
jgi:hypothetical protein